MMAQLTRDVLVSENKAWQPVDLCQGDVVTVCDWSSRNSKFPGMEVTVDGSAVFALMSNCLLVLS